MVLVYAESPNGQFKKAAFEAVAYGHLTAQAMGTTCVALVLGKADDAGQLGRYGATRVYQVQHSHLANFDSQVYASVIASAAQELGTEVVVVSHSSTGKSLLGRLAVKLNAGSVAGAKSVPNSESGFSVQKGVFSGKATATYAISSAVKVLSVMGNSLPATVVGDVASVEVLDVAVPAPRVQVKEVKSVSSGKAPLPEAELVVSAGRGLKGPENWGIVEDLADALGATTACSRPVADIGWRPHHEHVGQTGVAIRPNLYIAAGISGAIQHLAGVNSSKVIVVINKDPEAPFFKAADYGVVGDAFEVLPRLTDAVKRFKNS